MALPKEEADALRQCIRILAPYYGPEMRGIHTRNVESYITEGKWIPAWELKDIARLFYPYDKQLEAKMEAQMLAAMKSKELQSTPQNQSFLSADLAGWVNCPPVPSDSPLRFWLPEWMHEAVASEVAASRPTAMVNKIRRNSLDPAIDKAIKLAGNMELADVYLQLKELAIQEERPFSGIIDGEALCYTNDNGQPDKLTKNALRKRLKNREN